MPVTLFIIFLNPLNLGFEQNRENNMKKRYIPFFLFLNLQIALCCQANAQTDLSITGSVNPKKSDLLLNIESSDNNDSLKETARFLTQATLGANYEEIKHAALLGIDEWLEEQFSKPITFHKSHFDNIVEKYVEEAKAEIRNRLFVPRDERIIEIPFVYGRYAWWETVMNSEDHLRQRMALALSEILVISILSDDLFFYPLSQVDYYDLLLKHAFGNFGDLLYEVTLHPSMGIYLSHAGNVKADPEINRFPDENYAREVMQLFSIGLFELNPDGSRVLDENGEPISTYTNKEITEFAKIFTGLDLLWELEDQEFVRRIPAINRGEMFRHFMEMDDDEHEPGEKQLLNGKVVPGGQTGLEDISDAIDNLFNHPNVGPFIGRKLIQRLVTSNPSPEYINRVTAAFNDNGSGVRGDMKAVIKAILLDQEARDMEMMDNINHGMLREPFIRYVSILKVFNAQTRNGVFHNAGFQVEEMMRQHVLTSPSVFNFFLPDYSPKGPISDAGLVAPEFQITTSTTAITSINFMEEVVVNGALNDIYELYEDIEGGMNPVVAILKNRKYFARFNLQEEVELAEDLDALIDRLDLVMVYGNLSDETKQIVKDAISQFDEKEEQVRFAIFLISISPEYTILK